MTIGQRIAALRKEQHLSQEELGEKLGVSRQSIYKWESDASLPEIDKLITLSRLFGVSVGYLLGVEESKEADEKDSSSELSEQQLKMVEEIVDRYIAAQNKPQPPSKKWPRRIAAGVLVLAVLITAVGLNNQFQRLNRQYNNLANSMSDVQHTVRSQIDGISYRVEEILKSQNNLTADYDATLQGVDCAENTATFQLRAVPKTYVSGMRAVFSAEINGKKELVEAEGALGPGQEFSAELVCPLADEITLCVTFISGDTRETQLLDQYFNLYNSTFPAVDIDDFHFMLMDVVDNKICLQDIFLAILPQPDSSYYEITPAEIVDIRVGVFKNCSLIAWGTPCQQPPNYYGFDGYAFYALPDVTFSFTETDVLQVAALVTDEYGRQQMLTSSAYALYLEDDGPDYLSWSDDGVDPSTDPADWKY